MSFNTDSQRLRRVFDLKINSGKSRAEFMDLTDDLFGIIHIYRSAEFFAHFQEVYALYGVGIGKTSSMHSNVIVSVVSVNQF